MPKKGYAKPEELKFYLLLFRLEGHETWHGLFSKKMEIIEKQLKPPQNNTKITAKKWFEIDRLTGNFEEF